ncbi:MAG: class I SAM-dependent methyltransferase, partial [Gemmatimonadetes bacterium]|nr:class I SAM-dependent methyltransferase [Gemmatimonadota bacterium]
ALILGDPTPHLARALHATGHAATTWNRHLTRDQRCAPWPPSGPFGEVWVRMPRSSLEAVMLLHAGAARVPDGGCLYLYGASSEGIRSAPRHFPAGTETPHPTLIKRRCRVLASTRAHAPPRPDSLDTWEIRAPIDWGTGERDWSFYPGVFACGRLDPATSLLIDHLPRIRPGGRVLDFGAGTGVIGAASLERQPDTEMVLLERDAIALVAAARNVNSATRVLGRTLAHAQGPFDLIVSNPPIHIGKSQSLETVSALIRDAPEVLSPRGIMVLVAQRRLPIPALLERSFRSVRTVADRGPFRVWQATPAGR